MTKKISFTVTDNQYDQIVNLATSQNISITDCIINALPITRENKLTLDIIDNKVSKINPGTFTISSLFPIYEWKSFSKGSRLGTSRLFYNKITSSDTNVKFLYKSTSNLATYVKEDM